LVLAYFQVAALTLTGVRQVNRMRHKYLAAVLRQDVGYFDTTATSGRLLQGLNEDCQTIQLGIGEKVGTTIFNLSTAIAGITIAFTRGWAMTLVMLAVTPVLAGMGYCIATFMSKNTAFINKAYGAANSIAQQALANVRTVYAFNGAERMVEAYSACLDTPMKVGIRQGFLGGVVVGMTNCAFFCSWALALWFGSTRIVAGTYTGGRLRRLLGCVVRSCLASLLEKHIALYSLKMPAQA
jgi:ATP-binding cassette subfamily B (MDR/TAP) protein 1